MTAQNKESGLFPHILVAVDASAHTEAGLDTVLYLTDHLGSRVKGLFIRSPELHHICRLTFLSEISELTGEIRPFSEYSIEKQISLAEKRVQHRVQFLEVSSPISCSWTSVTGSAADQILDAVSGADLIVLEQTGRSSSQLTKLANTVRTVSKESKKPILVVKRTVRRINIVISLHDGSEQSHKRLDMAMELAEAIRHPLAIMILLNDSIPPQEVISPLREKAGEVSIPIGLSVFKGLHKWDFVRTVNRFSSGLLIMPADMPVAKNRRLELEYLLDLVDHSLLLIN